MLQFNLPIRAPITLWVAGLLLVLVVQTASASTRFELSGSLTSGTSALPVDSSVSGFIIIRDSAAGPGNVSVDANDVLSYQFAIGCEIWSGDGSDFAGIFGFEISADGSQLLFQNAGGGLTSSPSGFFLDIVTNPPDPTEWRFSEFDSSPIASAEGTMQFLRVDTIFADSFQLDMNRRLALQQGNVTFSMSGQLTEASSPFFQGQTLTGSMIIKQEAATNGYVSTDPSDVLVYDFSLLGSECIETETWSGDGSDFAGIFRFEISADGSQLLFQNAGGGLTSNPGGFFLDIVTNDPDPTEWIISSDPLSPVARAVDTVQFTR